MHELLGAKSLMRAKSLQGHCFCKNVPCNPVRCGDLHDNLNCMLYTREVFKLMKTVSAMQGVLKIAIQ